MFQNISGAQNISKVYIKAIIQDFMYNNINLFYPSALCLLDSKQKQLPELFMKKAVLKKFARLRGKHLCWSLF